MNMPYYPPGSMNYNMRNTNQTIFDWTLGIEAAKAYFVPPGVTAFLLDREASKFYVKQVDAAGIPVFFQSYTFAPTQAEQPPVSSPVGIPASAPAQTAQGAPVSREEFDRLAQTVADMSAQISNLQSAKKPAQKKQEAE